MATTYDIEVTQGSELDLRLNVKNDAGAALTLEGYKLRGIVKHRYGDTAAYIDLKPKVFTDRLCKSSNYCSRAVLLIYS